MAVQLSVAHVEGGVADEQADDLAVGHVDDGLALLGVAVSRLCVREGAGLPEPAQICPGQSVGLALVEVSAQPEMPVGEGEDRLRLCEALEVERGFTDRPRVDLEGGVLDHDSSSSAEVADHDIGAVRLQRVALAHPIHADHVAEFAGASGLDAGQGILEDHRPAGSTPNAFAPARNVSGAGLPCRCSRLGDDAVDHSVEQTRELRGGEHVMGVGARRDHGAAQPGALRGLHVADRALVGLDALLVDQLQNALILVIADPMDRVGVRRVIVRPLGQLDPPRLEE